MVGGDKKKVNWTVWGVGGLGVPPKSIRAGTGEVFSKNFFSDSLSSVYTTLHTLHTLHTVFYIFIIINKYIVNR